MQKAPPSSPKLFLNRRAFLKQTSLASTAAALAPAISLTRAAVSNDTIHIGVIGAGGRARGLMQVLTRIPKTKIIAVCDIYDAHLSAAKKIADAGAFATHEYERLLERKDVDAVLIGSPDHWHVPMTIDACAAGKDVYVEKPLTHSRDDGKTVVAAQDRYHRVVQVGTQQRSMPQFHKARRMIQEGVLGKIHKVHLTWNRNFLPFQKSVPSIRAEDLNWKKFLGAAPEQPFDAYRFRNWRWFWDFGGGILTDLMVHWLDGVNWLLDLGMPAAATTVGDHFATKGVWETPDTIQTFLQYPDKGLQIYFEGTFVNARNRAMTEIMGENATLYLDRGRLELHPESGRKLEPKEIVLGSGPRGADFFKEPDGELLHLTDWLDAIRARKKPSAPAEAGVLAAEAAHMANRAYREGRVVRRVA
ncbi:MAG: Gfo/Idh/MocA family oxidoreductase [Verrucomicrobia bacterium]|nr:Gfo/Idh/MocA family oxidoreductase [Verrucomicrobiota bacterium]